MLGGLTLAPNVRTAAEQPFGKPAFMATFVKPDGISPLSPWHDLPLYPDAAQVVSLSPHDPTPRAGGPGPPPSPEALSPPAQALTP